MSITTYIMAAMLAVIVAGGGYHAWTVHSMNVQSAAAVKKAADDARTAALKECAAANKVATDKATAEAAATQAALSKVAAAQLSAALLAKSDTQRLADGFARQLVKQAQAKPLATPCNITAERADLLNRATGAVP